jgi:hypothetical protein
MSQSRDRPARGNVMENLAESGGGHQPWIGFTLVTFWEGLPSC